jgi:hypothetical protein
MQDIKTKVVIEQIATVSKLKKLQLFLISDKFKEIETDQAELLILQAGIMAAYMQCLNMRIKKL